jgi:putative transposase
MVRARMVTHPAGWQWCGYGELLGEKARYRLLDMDKLLELLGINNTITFRTKYAERIQLAITNKELIREKRWTESIAVGSQSYVEKVAESLRYKHRRFVVEDYNDGSCAIWDPPSHYSQLKR